MSLFTGTRHTKSAHPFGVEGPQSALIYGLPAAR